LAKARVTLLKGEAKAEPVPPASLAPTITVGPETETELTPKLGPGPTLAAPMKTLRLVGVMPPEVWNRFGTKVLPKLRSGGDLKLGVDFTVSLDAVRARNIRSEICQLLDDLGLSDELRIEEI